MVSKGEAVEAELDRLIERRHERRVADEGERPAEEMWGLEGGYLLLAGLALLG